MHLDELGSQSRVDLSSEQETIISPSGEYLANFTQFLCPVKEEINLRGKNTLIVHHHHHLKYELEANH